MYPDRIVYTVIIHIADLPPAGHGFERLSIDMAFFCHFPKKAKALNDMGTAPIYFICTVIFSLLYTSATIVRGDKINTCVQINLVSSTYHRDYYL